MVTFEPLIPDKCEIAESAVWSHAAQALFFVDIFGFSVHRVVWPDMAHTRWPMPCEPGSLAVRDDGKLLVGLKDGLVLLDPETGGLTHLADPPYDTSHMRFNDGCCDARGRFWTGTMDRNRARFCAGLWVYEDGLLREGPQDVMVSNGLAFSRDGRWMYHADSGRNVIWRYPYDLETGTPGPREAWFHTPSEDGAPDGAAVDAEDHYWIAMYEGGCLLRITPEGRLDRRVQLPVRNPTMVTFAGPRFDCLIVTTSRYRLSEAERAQFPQSGGVLIARDTPFVGVPGPLVTSASCAVIGGG